MIRASAAASPAFFLTLLVTLGVGATWASAQQDWQPFKDRDERVERTRRAPKDQPPRGTDQPTDPEASRPAAPAFTPPPSGAVERVELAPLEVPAGTPPPVPPTPGSRIASPPPATAATSDSAAPANTRLVGQINPDDFWRGVDMAALEAAIQALDVPPRSPALHGLWQRLLAPAGIPPSGGRGPNHFGALQLEALYRSGLIGPLRARLAATVPGEDALITAFRIRGDLAAADTEAACANVKTLTARRDGLPKALVGEAHVLGGYCAAVQGNRAAAGLAAELAREEEIDAPLALQALDAIAAPEGAPRPKFALPKRLMVLDYRLLELIGPMEPAAALANAEPALLYALANTAGTPPRLAVAAAEAAAALHALDGPALADVYKRAAASAGSETDAATTRAKRFASVTTERDAVRRLTIARQLLDEAAKAGTAVPMAQALATVMSDIEPAATLGPAAATAAEIAVSAGQFERARRFAAVHSAAVHWAPLAELADPELPGLSGPALEVLDHVVRRNAFQPAALHRLATVLDALDTNVPIPLWEAASRTPQPNTGHLPPTGTLPRLRDAAGKRELAHTMLLAMQSIGPGAASSHLIALGDSLRALRRAGLDAEARALALDALLAIWPRT